ncbi:hypothetical protein [Roseivirga sp.]|uniref:hypothetical protein n=1 Tax=Roseivirga sp. TaxID=1964215 RepID=UPI003B8E37BE
MSRKEELQKANDKIKNSLETQLSDLKQNMDNVGKGALIIGGGLLGAYLLTNTLTKSDKKKKTKKVKRDKDASFNQKDNLLMSTVKEQAFVFLLGLAAERLTSFLNELEKDEKE